MICEACGNIAACETLEDVTICADCAPAFRRALDDTRSGDAWGRARDAHVVARALLRERGGTMQLLLRDLPAPVVRAFKARAAADGVTVRELFLAAAERYLQKRE